MASDIGSFLLKILLLFAPRQGIRRVKVKHQVSFPIFLKAERTHNHISLPFIVR